MYLSIKDTDKFFHECDPNEDGFVLYSKLCEMFMTFSENRMQFAYAKEEESRDFSSQMYDREQFGELIQSWQIPEMMAKADTIDAGSRRYEAALPLGRRLQAHWAMEGPQSTFVTIVICTQIALGTWLLVREILDRRLLDLLGWGLVLAKTSAGVLYPTLALLIFSSSRTLGTLLRRSSYCSRFINWDLSQTFHIQMAIVTTVFSILHVIGHLGGTFVHLARSQRGVASMTLHNFDLERPRYRDLLRSRPGITGLLAIVVILLIGICSQPHIRQKRFEVFQGAHLLVYPLLGLLIAHGTKGWIQAPMLGYWLAGPTCLLIAERSIRVYRYCKPVMVEVFPQKSDVVMLVLQRKKTWKVSPGQYMLLCIPQISWLQWHPFTISSFSDHEIRIHIRTTSGAWTNALNSKTVNYVLIDGPFGAPVNNFYAFDRTIIIGAGIGITPYIGVLSNKIATDPRRRRKSLSGAQQMVDVHWVARDASVFSWFATLLNDVAAGEDGVVISTYLTAPQTSITQYVFSVLFDRGVANLRSSKHDLAENDASLLTGLKNMTKFGRPDFSDILIANEQDLPLDFSGTIGVFFCGPKYVGMELADRCRSMTILRNRKVKWQFVGEVF